METPIEPTKTSQKTTGQTLAEGLLDSFRVLIGGVLALLGGIVTALFGVFMFGYVVTRIGGGRPAPELFGLVVLWGFFGAAPLFASVLLVNKGNLSGKRWLGRTSLGALLLLFVLGADANLGPANWHAALRREKLPGPDAASLNGTIVTPHLEVGLNKGTNLLWCGTFQLAWNEACALVGGDLNFDREHPMVAVLNRHAFTKESLDEGSYVAMAGFVGDNIHEKIQQAVNAKFQGAFKPRFVPDKGLMPRPQDFVAYACLYKNLSFPTPFERLDDALQFEGVRVFAFGVGRTKASHESMLPQVAILDYQSENDFVVELKTKSEGERLVLAKVQPRGTFADTVASVRERMKTGKPEATATNDVLIVPRMKFDLTRVYSELQNRLLIARGANVSKDLLLRSAVQSTKFEMNEKGVELKSEAHMAFACAAESPPVRQHIMVFDKPFLILMERAGAKMPYFALWVDNSELLARW